MDWGTLIATGSGGLIAISGTVLADFLRHRHENDRTVEARRRAVYNEFIVATGTCHTRLRELAQGRGEQGDLETASRAALTDAGIYDVRERLFIEGSTTVAGAGQAMFVQLRALRRVVATGAAQDSPAYHAVYHPYLAAVWGYRAAVREELDGRPLVPADFGWAEWGGRDSCAVCRAAGAAD
ncbi:CchlQ [Streptomyces monticola]|uniref:CchlQ n=1 Tax=Streptomyces monticola TaxID=2666263 RepID=A0ABW2JEC9_9ACTN